MRLYVGVSAVTTLVATLYGCDAGGPPVIEWEGDDGQPTEALIDDSWTPWVDVGVLDVKKRQFVVDTGAPLTYVDAEVYEVERLASGDLGAFGLMFPERPLIPLQIFGDVELCGGIRPGGLLGGDILSAFDFVGDYQMGRLYLFEDLDGAPPSEAEVLAESRVEISVLGGGTYCVDDCSSDSLVYSAPNRLVVRGDVEGEAMNLLLDTGASFVSLPTSVIERLERSRPRLGDVAVQSVAGIVESEITRVADIALGDADTRVANVPTLILEDDGLLSILSDEVGVAIEGLLGGTYLRQFLFVVDYASEELRLFRYAQPDHVDTREFIGPGFELDLCAGSFRVSEIYESTSVAEKHEVALGDEVVAIDGRLLAGQSLEDVRQTIRSIPAGQTLQFTFRRLSGADGSEQIEIQNLLPELE